MTKQRVSSFIILLISAVFATLPFMAQPVWAQAGRGMDLYDSWDFKGAETALREALKANPDDLEARYFLGLSLLMQDKHHEALDVLLKVKGSLDKDTGRPKDSVPNEYEINLALARTRLELKQNDEALKDLDAAAKGHADTADLHVYRGVYYLNLNKTQEALKELDKAMSMDENNAYAHYYAGHAYLRLGNPAKAVEMLKTFLQLAPDAPEAAKAKALFEALC